MGALNNGTEILIVEDSPTQAMKLRYFLEKNGYSVTVAQNGKEALDYLEMNTDKLPTFIISDVNMPVMDGYEFCRQLKSDEHTKGIPVILVTALSDPKDIIKGLEVGAENFIIKPYDEKHLLYLIQHILVNLELRREESVQSGVEIFFRDQKYFITAARLQIINLLLCTYETAVQKNLELIKSRDELRKLNEQLEQKVEERTAALKIEIDEHKRDEEALQTSEEKYRLLADNVMDIIWTMDLSQRFTYISPSVERIRGYTVQEAISQKLEEVFTPYSFKVAMKSFEKQLAEEKMKTKNLFKSWTLELEQMCKDGSTMWNETRMTFMRNSDGSPVGILGVTRDITETVQIREKLRALSLHDELTGLYNRRGFLNLAQQQIKIADRTKTYKIMDEILLLFIDLDKLKQINDELGHNEGDRALIDTAKILKKTFRESDIIARFGGDEFAILALKTREDKTLCERLQKNIDAYNALGNSSYTLSISIGVTIYNPEKPSTLDELISRADTLMYEHKKSKKNW